MRLSTPHSRPCQRGRDGAEAAGEGSGHASSTRQRERGGVQRKTTKEGRWIRIQRLGEEEGAVEAQPPDLDRTVSEGEGAGARGSGLTGRGRERKWAGAEAFGPPAFWRFFKGFPNKEIPKKEKGF